MRRRKSVMRKRGSMKRSRGRVKEHGEEDYEKSIIRFDMIGMKTAPKLAQHVIPRSNACGTRAV